jgi:hypothetical protein
MNLTTLLMGLLGVVMAFGLGHWRGDSAGYDRGVSEKQDEINRMVIDHQNALILKNGQINDLSTRLQEQKDEADADRVALHDKNRVISAEFDRVRSERNGLRGTLDAALATRIDAAGAEAALQACREHGESLNRQLDLGVQLLAKLANRAQGCAIDLRAVLQAWPASGSEFSSE